MFVLWLGPWFYRFYLLQLNVRVMAGSMVLSAAAQLSTCYGWVNGFICCSSINVRVMAGSMVLSAAAQLTYVLWLGPWFYLLQLN